jgi:hypothetical protein
MVNLHEFDAMTEPGPNPSREGNHQDADECLLPSRERVVVVRFMKSRLSIFRMGWDHELLKDARQRESADKSDALQTIRASGRVTGRRVSVWSACARR